MKKKFHTLFIAFRKLLRPLKAIILLIVLLVLSFFAQATNYTWIGTTSTNWATITNWSPNGNPGSAAGDVVTIATAANQPILTIAPANELASLTFAPTNTTALSLTINGVTLSVTNAVTLNNRSNSNTACTISGSGTLSSGSVVLGSGVLPTSNNTTRTQTMTSTIASFIISDQITLNSIIGSSTNRRSNSTFIHTSGIITVSGITTVNANASNTSTFTMGNSSPTLNLTGTTPFTISPTGTNTITLTGTGATVDYQSTSDVLFLNAPLGLLSYRNLIISGGSGNTKTLQANTTLNGTLTVRAATTLDIGAFTIGTPTSLTLETVGGGTGSSIIGSGTLTVGGNISVNYTGSGAITSGASINTPIAIGGTTRTYTVTNDGTSTNVELSIAGIISGTGGIIKAGSGILLFSGANTYNGTTTISAGTLVAGTAAPNGSAGAFGNATSDIILGDANTTINASSPSLQIGGAFTVARTITVANQVTGGIYSIGGNTDNNSTFSRAITINQPLSITQVANAGANTLSITGGITAGNAGTKNVTFDNVGAVIVSTTAISPGTGNIAVVKQNDGALTMNVTNTYAGGTTLSSGILNINNTQALGANTGIFTITGGTIDNTSGGNITTINYPLALNGDFTYSGSVPRNLNLGTGTITMNDNRQVTVSAGTLTIGGVISAVSYSLTKSGSGSLSFGTNPVTLNDLIISAGTLTSTTGTMNLAGDLTNNSVFTHNSGTVIFNGSAQIIGGSTTTTFNNLTISSSNSTTLGINTLVASNLNITTGDFFDLNTYTCNRSASGGTLTVAGTLLLGGTTGGQGASNFPSGFSTFAMTGGTVNYDNSTGGQTIYSTPTYATLTLGNTNGTQTAGGNITANILNNNANSAEILNMGTNTLTVTTPNNTGTIRTQNISAAPISSGKTWGGTVQFDGASAQTIPAATFSNLILNNTGGATLGAAVTVNGILTLTSGILTTTGTNLLSDTNTSTTAISGGSATSFINGPVKWTLPSNLVSGSIYNLPVGKGTTYLPFSLVNPTTGAIAPTVQVEAFTTNSGGTIDGTLNSKSTTEYWSLTTTGNFSNSSLSLNRQTAISPLDGIGGSTAVSGTYTTLAGTPENYGVTGSDLIGTNRFFVLAEQKKTITTISINGSPFCAGSTSISVPFTYTPKAIFSGAMFIAQLSNAAGAFTSPVTLENVASNGTGSQSLNVTIPLGTTAGTGYRIRIVSTTPSVTGSDNGANLIISGTVAAQPDAITPSTTTPCANTAGVTYSVTNVAGVTYTWTFPSGWTQTGGGTTNSVTVTTGTASGNVVVTPSNSCGSGPPQTLEVSVIPSPTITVQPSTTPQSVCQDGTLTAFSVTATGATSYQWYKNTTESNSGGTLLSGATSSSYLPLSTTAGTLYYYCVVSGACSPAVTSDVSGAVTVVVPELLIATPASRCDAGTLSLSVTRSNCLPSSTVDWYSALTGGTLLASNTTSYTPNVLATTTYYAQETFTGGLITPGANPIGTVATGLVFNLYEKIVLNSVTISASGTATSITIGLRNNAGAAVSGVSDVTLTPSGGSQVVQLGWTIPAGTGYQILKTTGTMNLATTNSSFPVGFNVGSITSSIENGTVNSGRYDYFYNWSISRVRVPVTATIGAPIVSGFSGSSCGSGVVALSASASSGTITWYDALTGGNVKATGTTYSPDLTTSTTFYIASTDGNCTSTPRVPVTASIITKPTITATGNGSYCSGSTVTLSSSGTGITNKYWTGPNGYYSLRDSVLTGVTSAASGTYTVIGSALSNINLVYNGDFESGNTGFGSSYGYATPSSSALQPEGVYTVVADPSSVHGDFDNCVDHTSGTGTKQMVVNGATVANVNIWSQTVNVVPNTDYQYTYWIQSVVEGNPARLQLYINGSPAGPIYTADLGTCSWRQFTYNWNSGSSKSAYLSLVNQNVVAGGNDFALDDIVFRPACTTEDPAHATADPNISNGGENAAYGVIYVTVSAVPTAGAIGTNQSICSGVTPATLTSTAAGTGSGTISYEWQTNGSGSFVTIPGATSATYSPPPLTSTTSYQRRTVTTNYGTICYSSYTTAVTITVSSAATAVAGGPDVVCQSSSPTPITLSGAKVEGSATTGAWSILTGGGSLSNYSQTATPATVTYTPSVDYSGTVTLRLTTNNSGGCSAIADRIIIIRPTPTASISGTTSVCQNGTNPTITFTNPQAFPVTVTYNINGLNQTTINVGANTTATISAPTTTSGSFDYNLVSVVYQTAPACSNTISGLATVTVNPTLTTSISGGTSPICSNTNPGTFTATGGGGIGAYTYLWYKDGVSTGVTTPTYAPGNLTATSTFYCAITSGACGPINTSTTTINVNTLPEAPSAGNVTVAYDGLPHTGTATPPSGSSIAWYNASTGGSTTVAPVGTSAGVYSAWAESVNNTTGCISSSRTLVTVTISKAVLTITAGNQTVAYGTLATTVTGAGTYTPSGFVNSETSSVIGGTVTYTTTYTATTPAGTSGVTITPVITSLSATNYSFTPANGSITIGSATSTISATGTTSYTYTGTVQGPATSTVTGSTGTVTYSYSGTGTTTYGPSPTQPTNAGTYQVIATVAADANYNGATSSPLAFTISKAMLTITAGNQTVAYGTLASTVTGAGTYIASGFVNSENSSVISGTATYTTTYTATTPAGTTGVTITPVVTGLTATNYSFTPANGSITIGSATSTISSTGTTSYTYTGLVQGPATSTVTGSTGAVTYSYSGTGSTTYGPSVTRPINAGTYQVIATVAADANFNGATSAPLAFTINKAVLTITAGNQTVAYGTMVAMVTGAGTYTPSGFVNSETTSVIGGTVTYTTTYTATTPAGTAGVTIAPVVTGLTATNYSFTPANGSIIISNAASTITATGTTSYTYTGLVQGPATSTVTGSTGAVTYGYSGTGTTSYGPSATQPINAGTYQVIATVAADANYNGATSAPLDFTINKAVLTITAGNQTVAYGTMATTVAGAGTYTPSGFVNSETSSVIGGTVTYTTTYTATTPAGTAGVTITPVVTGLSATNYSFTPANGSITIIKAASTISATGIVSYTYTGTVQGPAGSTVTGSTGAVSYNYSGTGTTSYGPSATQPINTGTYQVVATVATDTNYNSATSAPLAFTINKAVLTITAGNQTVAYGTLAATVTGAGTYTPSGFVNSENSSVIGGTATYTTTYTATTTAGTAGITITPIVTSLTAANYTFTPANGNITIIKATSTITATGTTSYNYNRSVQGPASSTVTGSSGAVTYSYSGTGTTSYGPSTTQPMNAGTYQVIATVAADANYNEASSTPLAFTINRVSLSITANNQIKCVDDIFNFTGSEFSSAGLISGDVISGVTLTSSGSGAGAAVGPYPIVPSTPTGSGIGNYNITYINGTLTVNAKPAATISYAGSPFCSNFGIGSVTRTGTTGGTYSAPSGLAIDPTTGDITTTSSNPGSYIVTYTMPAAGGCGIVTTTCSVVINLDGKWTGNSDTDWNKTNNWECNALPTLSTNVIISSGLSNYPNNSTGSQDKCNNLTIQANSSVTVTGNTLQIAGTINNNGMFTATSGTIEMHGSVAQSIPANKFTSNTIQNLNIDNPSGATLVGMLYVTGIVKAKNGNLISDGNLTLLSTATQTALIDGSGSGNVTGSVTMQRYIPSAFGYKYVSSPFSNTTVNAFSGYVNLNATFPTFYKYDENHQVPLGTDVSGWTAYTSTSGSLNPLEGYSANFGTSPIAKTMSLTGLVNNGDLSVDLSNHNRTFTKGFNLVGNPYPSPIDWDAVGWTKTNISGGIYFFNASAPGANTAANDSLQYLGEYSSYVNGVSTGGADNNIGSMQGFFVHVSAASGRLGVSNSVRTKKLDTGLKEAFVDQRTILRFAANFKITNATEDAAVIYFDEQASRSFDEDKDALKMMNTNTLVPNLYFLSTDSKQLSISGMPTPSDSISKVPLGITILRDGWINFNAKDISQLPSSLHIYLVDNEKRVSQDLKQQPEYLFYLKAGVNNQRLTLVFSLSEINPITPVTEKMFTVIHSASLFMIKMNLPFNTKGSIFVTNMKGQMILRREVFEQETVEISPSSASGLYIITVISGNRKTSEKILIRKDYE